jgi:hypothetical protein
VKLWQLLGQSHATLLPRAFSSIFNPALPSCVRRSSDLAVRHNLQSGFAVLREARLCLAVRHSIIVWGFAPWARGRTRGKAPIFDCRLTGGASPALTQDGKPSSRLNLPLGQAPPHAGRQAVIKVELTGGQAPHVGRQADINLELTGGASPASRSTASRHQG